MEHIGRLVGVGRRPKKGVRQKKLQEWQLCTRLESGGDSGETYRGLSILRFPLLLYQDCRSVWLRFFLILIWFWPNLVEFLFSPPCPGGRIDQPKLNTPIPQVMLWHLRGLEGRKGELRRRKQKTASSVHVSARHPGLDSHTSPAMCPDCGGPCFPGFTWDLVHCPRIGFYKLPGKPKPNYNPERILSIS